MHASSKFVRPVCIQEMALFMTHNKAPRLVQHYVFINFNGDWNIGRGTNSAFEACLILDF